MTQRGYLFFIFLIACANLTVWLATVSFVNPDKAGIFGFFFFYVSLFITLFSLLYLLSYYVHARLLKWGSVFKNVQVSTRQSILFSILLVGSLALRSFQLLTWYNLLLFILVLTFLEFILMSRKKTVLYGRKT